MDSRSIHRSARSVLFVLLFALVFLASVPLKDVSAHGPLAPNALPRSQTDIAGPAGSGAFGTRVIVLPNGNFVVTDPYFDEGGIVDIGAVYLYSGATRTIISTLKGGRPSDRVGINGVSVLTNGNYVVLSPYWDNPVGPKVDAGAATWCAATTGCNGAVSASNSLVGGTAGDEVGIGGVWALTNGNYVVLSPAWDNPVGPVVDAGA